MEIFPEKNVIQKSWAAKKFFGPPQLRRQVSAHGIITNVKSGIELNNYNIGLGVTSVLSGSED